MEKYFTEKKKKKNGKCLNRKGWCESFESGEWEGIKTSFSVDLNIASYLFTLVANE